MKRYALAALLSLWAGGAGAADDPIKLKTTLVPLDPQINLLEWELFKDGSGFYRNEGSNVAIGRLQFSSASAELPVTIAGEKLTFFLPKGKQFAFRHGEHTTYLHPEGGGMRTVTLKLATGRDHHLAFPYANLERESRTALGWIMGVRDTQANLWYRAGGVAQFSLDGQDFRIFDRNADGYYRLADDSLGVMMADKSMALIPLGKTLVTGKNAYTIQKLAEDGSEIELARCDQKTGTVAIKLVGAGLEGQFALRSADAGQWLVSPPGDKAAALAALPGKYSLSAGAVYAGEPKALVASLAAGKLAPIVVEEGKTRQLELGAPFSLSFVVHQQKEKQIAIVSSDLHLYGKAGEEYTNFRWKTEPEISLVAGGKTIPVGKMKFG